jgi:hypothetical protein
MYEDPRYQHWYRGSLPDTIHRMTVGGIGYVSLNGRFTRHSASS